MVSSGSGRGGRWRSGSSASVPRTRNAIGASVVTRPMSSEANECRCEWWCADASAPVQTISQPRAVCGAAVRVQNHPTSATTAVPSPAASGTPM